MEDRETRLTPVERADDLRPHVAGRCGRLLCDGCDRSRLHTRDDHHKHVREPLPNSIRSSCPGGVVVDDVLDRRDLVVKKGHLNPSRPALGAAAGSRFERSKTAHDSECLGVQGRGEPAASGCGGRNYSSGAAHGVHVPHAPSLSLGVSTIVQSMSTASNNRNTVTTGSNVGLRQMQRLPSGVERAYEIVPLALNRRPELQLPVVPGSPRVSTRSCWLR